MLHPEVVSRRSVLDLVVQRASERKSPSPFTTFPPALQCSEHRLENSTSYDDTKAQHGGATAACESHFAGGSCCLRVFKRKARSTLTRRHKISSLSHHAATYTLLFSAALSFFRF